TPGPEVYRPAGREAGQFLFGAGPSVGSPGVRGRALLPQCKGRETAEPPVRTADDPQKLLGFGRGASGRTGRHVDRLRPQDLERCPRRGRRGVLPWREVRGTEVPATRTNRVRGP